MSWRDMNPASLACLNAHASRRLHERLGALYALEQLLAAPAPVDAEGDEQVVFLDYVCRQDLHQLVDVLVGKLGQQALELMEMAEQARQNTLALLADREAPPPA